MDNLQQDKKSLEKVLEYLEAAKTQIITIKLERERALRESTFAFNNVMMLEGHLRKLEEKMETNKEWLLLLTKYKQVSDMKNEQNSSVEVEEDISQEDTEMRQKCYLLLQKLIKRKTTPIEKDDTKTRSETTLTSAQIAAAAMKKQITSPASKLRASPYSCGNTIRPVDVICLDRLKEIDKLIQRTQLVLSTNNFEVIEPPSGRIRAEEMHAHLNAELEKIGGEDEESE